MSLSTNTTYRLFLEKLGGADPSSFIGDAGDVFLDPSVPALKLSDGSTPGGTSISGGLNSTLGLGNTSSLGMSVGVITATAINAPFYVDESEDDNANYNIPFLDTVESGDGYRMVQVDHAGLQFNPGLNALVVSNVVAGTLFGDGANITNLQVPGPYADDAAAAAGGVSVGSLYYRASGQVYTRLA